MTAVWQKEEDNGGRGGREEKEKEGRKEGTKEGRKEGRKEGAPLLKPRDPHLARGEI